MARHNPPRNFGFELSSSHSENERMKTTPQSPNSLQCSDSDWDRAELTDSSGEWDLMEPDSRSSSRAPSPEVTAAETTQDHNEAGAPLRVMSVPELLREPPTAAPSLSLSGTVQHLEYRDVHGDASSLFEKRLGERLARTMSRYVLPEHLHSITPATKGRVDIDSLVNSVSNDRHGHSRTASDRLDCVTARSELDRMAREYEAKLRRSQPPTPLDDQHQRLQVAIADQVNKDQVRSSLIQSSKTENQLCTPTPL